MIDTKLTEMLDDPRPIRAVTWADGQGYFAVGRDGVTKIVCYGEPGPYGYLPYLAVYRGEEIWQRIDATHREIEYFAAKE